MSFDDPMKAYFTTPEDYRRFVDSDPSRLRGDLRDAPDLIPDANSWLAPYDSLGGADGAVAQLGNQLWLLVVE